MFDANFTPRSAWRYSTQVALSSDGKSLLWNRPFDDVRVKDLDETEVFADFIALSRVDAAASDFEWFGRRRGPLLLCVHGLPRTHIDVRQPQFLPDDLVDEHRIETVYTQLKICEAIEHWRVLANQGRVMQVVADALRQDEATTDDQWEVLRPVLPDVLIAEGGRMRFSEQTVEVQRRLLAIGVQTWLDWGDVRTSFEWAAPNRRPEVRIGANSLFGVIALGLALTVVRSKYTFICARCGREFPAKRKRDPSKRSWCQDPACQAFKKAEEQKRRRARVRESERS